jgi:thymidylate synthase
MNDFMCTYSNAFMIRDGKLISHYLMRSNDAVFGYNNDVAWAKHVQQLLASELEVEVGDLIWTATNFHVYERHFKFIEKLIDEMGQKIY